MKFGFAQLTLGTLVKLGFFANLGVWLPMALLAGLGGLFGLPIVSFQETNVYGITALVVAIVLGLFFSIIGTAIFTLGAVIVRLLGDRAPSLELREKP